MLGELGENGTGRKRNWANFDDFGRKGNSANFFRPIPFSPSSVFAQFRYPLISTTNDGTLWWFDWLNKVVDKVLNKVVEIHEKSSGCLKYTTLDGEFESCKTFSVLLLILGATSNPCHTVYLVNSLSDRALSGINFRPNNAIDNAADLSIV